MFFFTGEDWQSAEAESYKKITADKLGRFLTKPLVIGSLITFLETDYKNIEISSPQAWFLLFDLHRFVLYDDDFSDEHARIGDIAYFINDITTEKHLNLIKLYGAKSPVVPIDFERVLNVLPFFLEQDRPGWLADFNTITGEIISARASKHPLTKSELSAYDETLKPESRPVGNSGRSFELPKIEPDLSAETNIIRLSDLRINALSIPVGCSLVAWREGRDKFICGGKHAIPNAAEMISLCESLERFQVMYHPPNTNLILSSYIELGEKALDPRKLFYDSRNTEFDPAGNIYWTESFEILTGKPQIRSGSGNLVRHGEFRK